MPEYYWCLTHETVEEGRVCRAASRLGPYATPEQARNFSELVERREETWQAQDEAWHGPDDD